MEYFDYILPDGMPARVNVDEHRLQQVPVQLTFNYNRSDIVHRTVLLNVLVTGLEFLRSGTYIIIRLRGINYELKWLGVDPSGYYRGFHPIHLERFDEVSSIKNSIRHWITHSGYMVDNFNLDLIVLGTPGLLSSTSVEKHIHEIYLNLIEGPELTNQYYEIVGNFDQIKIQPYIFNVSIINFPTWEELN